MSTIETFSSSLQYDWLYQQVIPDRTWLAKASSEDDYLQLVAFLLDASLRTLQGPGHRSDWLLWNGQRWCRVSNDFARGVFYAACHRLAEICTTELRAIRDKPPLMSREDAEAEVRSAAAAESTRVPDGPLLERKIAEVQTDEVDNLITANAYRILAFVRNDLFSIKGKQYSYWFRKFADDHILSEPVSERMLDQGNYINFLNGVYDSDAMAFVPHDKNLLLTRQAPVQYVPWDNSMEEHPLLSMWLNNIALSDRLFLQCYFGHSLSGINIEKVFLTVTGNKDTGKSSVSQALFSTFGKDTDSGYIHASQLRTFRRSTYISPGQPRPDIVSMLDARLTIVPETEGVEVSAETIKQLLSGGADYTGERDLFASSSSGVNKSAIMFVGNSMPFFDQSDDALTDRHFAIELDSLRQWEIQTDFNALISRNEEFREIFASWVMRGYEIYRSSKEGFRGVGATIVPLAGMGVKANSRITKNIVHEWAINWLSYDESLPSARPKDLLESFNFYRRSTGSKPVKMGHFYGNLEPYLMEISKQRPSVQYNRKTSMLKGVAIKRG